MVDVSTLEKLADWLNAQKAEVSLAIAVRIALRAGPLAGIEDSSLIQFCRATIISSVAIHFRPHELTSAILSAREHYDEIELSARAALSAAYATVSPPLSNDTSTYPASDFALVSAGLPVTRGSSAIGDDVKIFAESGNVPFLVSKPLFQWGDPQKHKNDLFLDRLIDLPGGAFWKSWYEGALKGEPVNWEMQRDVALITPEIWDGDGKALAAAIELMAARYRQPSIAAEVLRRQSTFLIENAARAQLTGEGLAAMLEAAFSDYMAEAPANQLPEEFAPLEALPRTLRRIAAAAPAARVDDARVQDLEAEIERLAGEVADLTSRLEAAEARGDGVFAKAFREQAGKSLGDWKFWTALTTGVVFLSGEAAVGATLERLAEVLGRAAPPGGSPAP